MTTGQAALRRRETTGWTVVENDTVWLARGDRDEIGVTDTELAILEAAPHVALKTIPDAAHFSITDAPHAVAELVVELLAYDER